MPQYSIGEALSIFLEKNKWKAKTDELRLKGEWKEIAGKTISKYTRNITLKEKVLTVFTDVAALKQEIMFSKQQLIATINTWFGEKVVEDIVVR